MGRPVYLSGTFTWTTVSINTMNQTRLHWQLNTNAFTTGMAYSALEECGVLAVKNVGGNNFHHCHATETESRELQAMIWPWGGQILAKYSETQRLLNVWWCQLHPEVQQFILFVDRHRHQSPRTLLKTLKIVFQTALRFDLVHTLSMSTLVTYSSCRTSAVNLGSNNYHRAQEGKN